MSQSLPPRCASRYFLERLIGTGAHGAVFLCTQVGLKRPAAIKVLHQEVAEDPEAVVRFELEARLTASLSHPHVVRVLEHDLEDAQPWIAYEYLEGLTLHQRVQQGPLPWKSALAAAFQVASALEAAHAAGMLHRDIKPSNVIEAGTDEFKLGDFGLARLLGSNAKVTRTGCVVGTPAYLAPEVMAGSDHSAQTDVFAVGAMLYKLATGQLPPRHDLVVVAGHAQDPGLPLPSTVRRGLPAALDRLVVGATHRDPASRFASARALREAAEEALEDPERGVTLPSARLRTVRLERDRDRARTTAVERTPARRAAWTAAAAVTVLALGALAIGLRRPTPAAWVDVQATPAASQAPVRRAFPDPAHFAQVFTRARHRWATHTEIIGLLNPLHPEVGRASQRAIEILPGARADHEELVHIADQVSDGFPDPHTAPPEALYWLTRTTSARFTAWSYLQVISGVNAATKRLIEEGKESSAGATDVFGTFAAIDLPHDGVVLIRRYQASALPMFAAMCATPERAGDEIFDLLFEAREIARMRGMARWAKRDDDELRKLVAQFEADLSTLRGGAGRALARLLSRFWDWGDPTGRVRITRGTYEEALGDLHALAEAMPGARNGIARLTQHMENEMGSFPAAARGR